MPFPCKNLDKSNKFYISWWILTYRGSTVTVPTYSYLHLTKETVWCSMHRGLAAISFIIHACNMVKLLLETAQRVPVNRTLGIGLKNLNLKRKIVRWVVPIILDRYTRMSDLKIVLLFTRFKPQRNTSTWRICV